LQLEAWNIMTRIKDRIGELILSCIAVLMVGYFQVFRLTGAKFNQAKLSTSRSHRQLVQEFFNAAVFGLSAIGTLGNSGKNNLRGPGCSTPILL
jgi:hypothetical protein